MARGRCAGCGLEDPSSAKVFKHINGCQEYLELWKSNPALALAPEEEMTRRLAEVSTDEYQDAKADAKDEKYAGYRANNTRRIDAQASRWKSKQFTSGHAAASPVATPSYGRLGLTATHIEEGASSSDGARRVTSRQAEIRVG